MSDDYNWAGAAASAYRAYAASTGNKNFCGEPMPAFDDLPQPIQTAWEAAARQVANCIEFGLSESARFEASWDGWTPPRLRLNTHSVDHWSAAPSK